MGILLWGSPKKLPEKKSKKGKEENRLLAIMNYTNFTSRWILFFLLHFGFAWALGGEWGKWAEVETQFISKLSSRISNSCNNRPLKTIDLSRGGGQKKTHCRIINAAVAENCWGRSADWTREWSPPKGTATRHAKPFLRHQCVVAFVDGAAADGAESAVVVVVATAAVESDSNRIP